MGHKTIYTCLLLLAIFASSQAYYGESSADTSGSEAEQSNGSDSAEELNSDSYGNGDGGYGDDGYGDEGDYGGSADANNAAAEEAAAEAAKKAAAEKAAAAAKAEAEAAAEKAAAEKAAAEKAAAEKAAADKAAEEKAAADKAATEKAAAEETKGQYDDSAQTSQQSDDPYAASSADGDYGQSGTANTAGGSYGYGAGQTAPSEEEEKAKRTEEESQSSEATSGYDYSKDEQDAAGSETSDYMAAVDPCKKATCREDQICIRKDPDYTCECAEGMSEEDGSCICPDKAMIKDKTSCYCPDDMTKKGDTCECRGKKSRTGETCTCPAHLKENDQKECVCPHRLMTESENECTCPATLKKEADECTCHDSIMTLEGDECSCPEDMTKTGDTCECQGKKSRSGGACVCPAHLRENDEKKCVCPHQLMTESENECNCPASMKKEGDECKCNDPAMTLEEGHCSCPTTMVVELNTCVCKHTWMTKNDDSCTCPTSMVAEGNSCKCKHEWMQWTEGACKCPPKMIPDGSSCRCKYTWQIDNGDGTCSCPEGMVHDGDSCSCKETWMVNNRDGTCSCKETWMTKKSDGTCACPTGMKRVDDSCECDETWMTNNGDGTCSCPNDMEKDGDSCRCKSDLMVLSEGKCNCREGMKLENDQCVCEDENMSVKDGNCQCPDGAEKTESGCKCTKALMVLKDGQCQCKQGFILRDGNCVCKHPDMDVQGEECVCPEGSKATDSGCVCSKPLTVMKDKKCQCKDGLIMKDGNCACEQADQELTEGECVDTDKERKCSLKFYNGKYCSKSSDNKLTWWLKMRKDKAKEDYSRIVKACYDTCKSKNCPLFMIIRYNDMLICYTRTKKCPSEKLATSSAAHMYKYSCEYKCKKENMEIVNDKCQCRDTFVLENEQCVCESDDMVISDNRCQCPEGTTKTDDGCKCTKSHMEFKDKKCQCKDGFVLKDDSCVCGKSDMIVNNGKCECPEGSEETDSGCTCTEPLTEMKDKKCQCKDGLVMKDGKCACAQEDQELKDGKCVETDKERKCSLKFYNGKYCSKSSDNKLTWWLKMRKDKAKEDYSRIVKACYDTCKSKNCPLFMIIRYNDMLICYTRTKKCPSEKLATSSAAHMYKYECEYKCKKENMEIVNDKCHCRDTFVLENEKCVCESDDMVISDNRCQCPEGTTKTDDGCKCTKSHMEFKDKKCQCKDGFVLKDDSCVCGKSDMIVNSGKCECPEGSEETDSGCICTEPLTEMKDKKCQCKDGLVMKDGKCACAQEDQELKDGKCVETDKEQKCSLKFYNGKYCSKSSDNKLTWWLKMRKDKAKEDYSRIVKACYDTCKSKNCPLFMIIRYNDMLICYTRTKKCPSEKLATSSAAHMYKYECEYKCKKENMEIVNDKCQCRNTFVLENEQCVCESDDMVISDNRCQCPEGTTKTDEGCKCTKSHMEFKDKKCQCKDGFVLKDESCVCADSNQVIKDGKCVEKQDVCILINTAHRGGDLRGGYKATEQKCFDDCKKTKLCMGAVLTKDRICWQKKKITQKKIKRFPGKTMIIKGKCTKTSCITYAPHFVCAAAKSKIISLKKPLTTTSQCYRYCTTDKTCKAFSMLRERYLYTRWGRSWYRYRYVCKPYSECTVAYSKGQRLYVKGESPKYNTYKGSCESSIPIPRYNMCEFKDRKCEEHTYSTLKQDVPYTDAECKQACTSDSDCSSAWLSTDQKECALKNSACTVYNMKTGGTTWNKISITAKCSSIKLCPDTHLPEKTKKTCYKKNSKVNCYYLADKVVCGPQSEKIATISYRYSIGDCYKICESNDKCTAITHLQYKTVFGRKVVTNECNMFSRCLDVAKGSSQHLTILKGTIQVSSTSIGKCERISEEDENESQKCTLKLFEGKYCARSTHNKVTWWMKERAGKLKEDYAKIYKACHDSCKEKSCPEFMIIRARSLLICYTRTVECPAANIASYGSAHFYKFVCTGERAKEHILKNAMQSSTGWGGSAARGIDGNTSPVHARKGCTHTRHESKPWWMAEITPGAEVTDVFITNRGDCCSNRLSNFQISVIQNKKVTDSAMTAGLCVFVKNWKDGMKWSAGKWNADFTRRYHCTKKVKGNYLVIRLHLNPRREPLSLCEVDYRMEGEKELPKYKQQAYRGSAKQSTTAYGGAASRGIDGSTNSAWGGASCTHTGNGRYQWWMMSITKSAPVTVTAVIITNRRDCCSQRLNNAEALVLQSDSTANWKTGKSLVSDRCAQWDNWEDGAMVDGSRWTRKYTCSKPMTGKFLAIRLLGKNMLTLCEVDYETEGGEEETDKCTEVKSSRSISRDDQIVDVSCPADQILAKCACDVVSSNDKEDPYCDGVTITKDARTCKAHGAVNKSTWKVKAKACCRKPANYVAVVSRPNSITDRTAVYLHARAYTKSFTAKCPPGLKMKACFMHTYWGPVYKGKKGFIDNGVCKSTDGCKRCAVQAVCETECDKVVVSSQAVTGDDRISEAKCPSGMVVAHCACRTDPVERYCDGVTVDATGTKCYAHGSTSNAKSKAVACCKKATLVKVVSKPEIITSAGQSISTKANKYRIEGRYPRVSCPRGSKLLTCTLHTYWAPYYRRAYTVVSGNTCSTTRDCFRCGVQVVCVKP